MKICMNANIMKTQFFHKVIYGLKCHFYVMINFVIFFTLRPLGMREKNAESDTLA